MPSNARELGVREIVPTFCAGWHSQAVAKGEVAQFEWRDVDFEAREIIVRGNAETGTKNWTVRRVPMIPDARALFARMHAERTGEPLNGRVFRVREAQRAINNAARKVGMTRIVHHDLRHLFATICIESGVDIPTVSRWLGHKDGGALAMKTYGHLRREHSLAQAQRVSFAPVGTKQADAIAFPGDRMTFDDGFKPTRAKVILYLCREGRGHLPR
jgi:integrase